MIGVEELRRQEGINAEEVFSELEEDLQQIEAKGFPMSQK
jgi:antitoxin ParD1/3/4